MLVLEKIRDSIADTILLRDVRFLNLSVFQSLIVMLLQAELTFMQVRENKTQVFQYAVHTKE